MAKKPKTQHERLVEYINDETLSGDSALVAAAVCLMEGAEIARDMKDVDSLIRIGNAWYDIAKTLLGLSETEEEKRPFGFGMLELAEVGEDDGVEFESDEGKGRPKVRKKSR